MDSMVGWGDMVEGTDLLGMAGVEVMGWVCLILRMRVVGMVLCKKQLVMEMDTVVATDWVGRMVAAEAAGAAAWPLQALAALMDSMVSCGDMMVDTGLLGMARLEVR